MQHLSSPRTSSSALATLWNNQVPDPKENESEVLSTDELKGVSGGLMVDNNGYVRFSGKPKEGKDSSFSELSDISRNVEDKKRGDWDLNE